MSFLPSSSGLRNSHIFYDDVLSQWRVQSLRDASKFLLLADKMPRALPFGRQMWELGSNLSICGKSEGDRHLLTFSRCFLGNFTCNSGHCVDIR